MHERDAREAEADAMARRLEEDERQAERDAEEKAHRELTARLAERELAIADEVASLVGQRGGTFETTHDVALANVATKLGYEYDRIEVADLLAADPRPTHPLG